jgi:hypothetical protein
MVREKPWAEVGVLQVQLESLRRSIAASGQVVAVEAGNYYRAVGLLVGAVDIVFEEKVAGMVVDKQVVRIAAE